VKVAHHHTVMPHNRGLLNTHKYKSVFNNRKTSKVCTYTTETYSNHIASEHLWCPFTQLHTDIQTHNKTEQK